MPVTSPAAPSAFRSGRRPRRSMCAATSRTTPACSWRRYAGCRPAWINRAGATACRRICRQGVTVTPRPDRTLSDLLVSGEIDAVISARPPLCFVQGARGVRRLFPDFRKEEERYFARTGIFPIMHVIAIRRPVYEAESMDRAQSARRFRSGEAGGPSAPARYPDLASAVGVGH